MATIESSKSFLQNRLKNRKKIEKEKQKTWREENSSNDENEQFFENQESLQQLKIKKQKDDF